MSSTHSQPTGMDYLERKLWMQRTKVRQTEVAKATGSSLALVTDVVRGMTNTPKARLVMEHIAERMGFPVTTVFPHFERRKGRAA